MTSIQFLKDLFKLLVLPPTGPILLAITGLAVARHNARIGWRIAFAGVGALALLSMPATGVLLNRSLDRSPVLDLQSARSAQAIVVLGGGLRRNAPEYGGATLGPLTLERTRYAARVARMTGLPLLVSGGSSGYGPAEALLIRQALIQEYRIPVRWIEARSSNTHENAVMSAELLRENGVERVILIGHSFDLPRTTSEFAKAGIRTIPAPIGAPAAAPTSISDFVPSVSGLSSSYYALYELAANAFFHLTP